LGWCFHVEFVRFASDAERIATTPYPSSEEEGLEKSYLNKLPSTPRTRLPTIPPLLRLLPPKTARPISLAT
jgi:hypothetical protein